MGRSPSGGMERTTVSANPLMELQDPGKGSFSAPVTGNFRTTCHPFSYISSMTTREDILYYALRYEGNWTRIALAIRNHERSNPVCCEEQFATIVDDEYPACLKTLRYPPWIIFWRGDLSLLDRPAAWITGSRACSVEGRRNTADVASVLRRHYVLAAGLSEGVEEEVHKEGLESGTIGVLSCGIDRILPESSRWLYSRMCREHLVLSEYPPGTLASTEKYRWRNRLLAALSRIMVVTECTMTDGTMKAVEEALELSRPVWCLPAAYSGRQVSGCNWLISQGAGILCSLESVRDL